MDKINNWEIYTEFKSKSKGTDIVICNLEDHVSKLGVREYVACPLCSRPEQTIGYTDQRRRKLWTDGYSGWCFRCDRFFLNPRPDTESTELSEFNLSLNIKNFDVKELDSDIFNGFSELNEEGFNYLQSRGNPILNRQFCNAIGFRSVQNGVVIPFYLENKLVYYEIRFIKVINQRRYWKPPGQTPIYIPFIVSRTNFIIVEGPFDAYAALLLYPEYTPLAVTGSKISLNQLKYLSERFNPESILVYLDDTKKSEKTCEFIKRNWLGSYDIKVIESDGTDPEEKLKSILNE